MLKPVNYPMAIIRKINVNDLGEITSVLAFKGSTRELVHRHSSSIIPLLTNTEAMASDNDGVPPPDLESDVLVSRTRRPRAAATACLKRLKNSNHN